MTSPRPAPTPPPRRPALRYVDSDCFLPPAQVAHAELLADARRCLASLGRLASGDRIDAKLEAAAFRLYNWLKQRSELLRAAPAERVSAAVRDETCQSLETAAVELRNELAARFLPLVIGTARKMPGAESYSNDELVSELAETLLGVIENFDVDRGFRFSTYATLAIRRKVSRLLRGTAADRQHRLLQDADQAEAPPQESERAAQRKWDVSQQLLQLVENLEPRERVILRARLGIDCSEARRPSLRRLGERLGLSRERIRQLEQQALRRVRRAASRRNISLTP